MSSSKYYYLCAIIFLVAVNTSQGSATEIMVMIGCAGSLLLSIYFSFKESK